MALSARQLACLEAMEITAWTLRHAGTEGPAPVQAARVTAAPEPAVEAALEPVVEAPVPAWDRLRAEVTGCTRCPLHESRTQTVFGVGDEAADWMIVGEAPGAEEDRQGEPFVGRAGQLLDNMLRAIGLQRAQVYIANILKCRPPRNRDPQPEEVAACRAYLERQIQWVRPRIILAVGRVAAQNLLQTTRPIGRLRGRVHRYPHVDAPVVVTYHPAYLLRSPGEKRKAWADLLLAREVAGRQGVAPDQADERPGA